jgi:cytochrome b
MADSRNGRAWTSVWDPVVRIGHWSLAIGIAAAWLTRQGAGALHEWIGYATLALVALRVLYGWLGSRHARFTQFVRNSAATFGYARLLRQGREPRYLGHNPLGGWMVVALLGTAALAGISGWLYTTDAWWGDERVEALHEGLANALLVLVALHVTGVVVTSWRHGENLVASMLHGKKRPAAGDDVD